MKNALIKPNDNEKYYTAITKDGKEMYLKLDVTEEVNTMEEVD
jgi:hypothetical protein